MIGNGYRSGFAYAMAIEAGRPSVGMLRKERSSRERERAVSLAQHKRMQSRQKHLLRANTPMERTPRSSSTKARMNCEFLLIAGRKALLGPATCQSSGNEESIG